MVIRSPRRTGCAKLRRTPEPRFPSGVESDDAGDEREDGARGEERARDLLRHGEDGEDAPDADEHDDAIDDAEQEAERRPAARRDHRVALGKPALVAVEGDVEGEAEADDDDEPDAGENEGLDDPV